MGILDRFRRPFSQRGTPGAVPSSSVDGGFGLSSSAWTVGVNPTSESCIRKISTTLASLNLTLYTHRKGGGRSPAYSDPLYLALRNPNPSLTPFLFYSQMVESILRHGNAYILRETIAGQIFFSLLDPPKVVITQEGSSVVYSDGNGRYTDKQILHIPYPIISNGKGVSPLNRFSDLIYLDNQLTAYIREYFRNSTGKRTTLELGDDWKNRKMDEVYSLIVPAVNKFVLGASNSGKVLIPPPGTKLGTHDVSQNLYNDIKSLKELVERQIAQSFGVPYSLISETNKYDSLEANQLQFLADAIEPLGTHIEQSFNRIIPPGNTNLYCKYDYKAMLQSDLKTTVDYLAKEVQSGLITINEARGKLDMSAVEAGDYTLVPANMWPLTTENVDAFFEQSKLAAKESGEPAHNGAGDDKQ